MKIEEQNSVSKCTCITALTEYEYTIIICLGIVAIVEEPVAKDEPEENPEEETRKNLAFLLEKVEGCSV